MKNLTKKISLITTLSFSAIFIFVPLITVQVNKVQLNSNLQNVNLVNNNLDSNITIGQQNISTIKQNNVDFNVTNNMNNIVPFERDSKINYLTNNILNNGIIIYDDNYQAIATSELSQMTQISNSKQITPSLISDAVPGSKGQYIYMAVTYVTDTSSFTGRYSAIWKLDIKTNKTTLVAKIPTDNTKYGGSSYDQFNSTSAIGIVPAIGGDLIVAFPEWLNSSTYCYQNIDYVIIDTSISSGNNIFCKYMSSSDLFSLPISRRILVESFYVSKIKNQSNKYALTIYGRSRDDGYKNYTVFDKEIFSINNNEIVIDQIESNKSYNVENWDASGTKTYQNYAAPLLYDQFNYMDSKPQYTASFIKYSSSLTGSITRSIDVFDSTKSGSNHVDKSPHVNNINISPTSNDPLIQGDISKDGSQEFWLMKKNNEIGNNISKTISLSNKIDNNFYLPRESTTIQGFSWADTSKTKMVLFDNNDTVSQYDLSTDKYTLSKGVAFASDEYVKKQTVNGSINEADAKNLVEIKGYDDSKYQTSYKFDKTNENKFSIEVSIKEGDNVVYNVIHTFEGKINLNKDSNNLALIIGASVGGAVVIIIIGLLAYYFKRKHTINKISKIKSREPNNSQSVKSLEPGLSQTKSIKKSARDELFHENASGNKYSNENTLRDSIQDKTRPPKSTSRRRR